MGSIIIIIVMFIIGCAIGFVIGSEPTNQTHREIDSLTYKCYEQEQAYARLKNELSEEKISVHTNITKNAGRKCLFVQNVKWFI